MRFVRHMRLMRCQTVAAALLLVTCCAGSANATVIISNLNGNDQNASTLVGNLLRSKALGFTLPAAGQYQLDSVVLRLDVGDATRTIAAGIYGSAAGVPSGSALVTFTIPVFTTGIQNYTLLPDATFLLQPLTTYFLVAYGTSPGSSSSYIDWLGNFSPVTPTGLATFAGAFADNSGAVTVPPTVASSVINSFAINATDASVPEPSTLSMMALFALSAGAVRRRRP